MPCAKRKERVRQKKYTHATIFIKKCISFHISRVRESHFSLAGHFVWRTSSPSPDILNYRRTLDCENVWRISNFSLVIHSPDIVLDLLSPDKMSGNINSGEFRVLCHIS